MKWSSYTLRAAAVIQAEIERLNKVLAELLQREGTTVTASNGSKNHAVNAKPERGAGGPLGATVTLTKALNGTPSTLSPLELLDELLLWGNEFNGSESKTKRTRRAPIYYLQGLKRVDGEPVQMQRRATAEINPV
jgi:hypothetical protein